MELKQEAIDAVVRKFGIFGHDVTSGEAREAVADFLAAGGYALVDRSALVGDDSFNSELLPVEESAFDSGYRTLVLVQAEMDEHFSRLRSTGPDEDDTSWKEFYDRCFGDDPRCWIDRVRSALRTMDREFPAYYNPDTTYQEDAMAWYTALNEMLAEFTAERGQTSEAEVPTFWCRQGRNA